MTAPKIARLERTPWRDRLQMNANGGFKANLFNACVAFREAAEFRSKIVFDEFALRTFVVGELPWSDDFPRAWTNHDDNFATEWIQAQGVGLGREVVQQGVETIAYESRLHPVRDWLQSLQWDGTPRIDDWLTYFLGVERSDYVQQVGRAWLISAVARVMQPGCKADHLLVLEGAQGIKKSTAIRVLAGDEWFTDELADFGSKDAGLQMRGVWIIELAELDHLNRTEASRIKSFITRSTDRFRPPYGARLIEAPRECVFAGTVNQDEYLKDETGNRRFWPVRCGPSIDIDGLAASREQLWAEAYRCYQRGDIWWLEDELVKDEALRQQRERNESDPWFTPIRDWIDEHPSIEWFTTTEILERAIGKRLADITDRDSKRVGKVLKGMGMKRETKRVGNLFPKAWIPPSG